MLKKPVLITLASFLIVGVLLWLRLKPSDVASRPAMQNNPASAVLPV